MSVEIWLLIMAISLTVAAVPTVHRIIVGPTILDRVVASDLLVVLVVAGIALYGARSGSHLVGPAMLALTAFAFISSLSVARFVSREDTRRVGGRTPDDRVEREQEAPPEPPGSVADHGQGEQR